MKLITILLLIPFTAALIIVEPDYKLRPCEPRPNPEVTNKIKVTVRGLPSQSGELHGAKTYYVNPGTNLSVLIIKTLKLDPLTKIERIKIERENESFVYLLKNTVSDVEKSLKSFILHDGDQIHIILMLQPRHSQPPLTPL